MQDAPFNLRFGRHPPLSCEPNLGPPPMEVVRHPLVLLVLLQDVLGLDDEPCHCRARNEKAFQPAGRFEGRGQQGLVETEIHLEPSSPWLRCQVEDERRAQPMSAADVRALRGREAGQDVRKRLPPATSSQDSNMGNEVST